MAVAFLADSSALWRIEREPSVGALWSDSIDTGEVGSCAGQRSEFMRSAQSPRHYDQMALMFSGLYPDVPHPKGMWRWIEGLQNRLVTVSAHRALSVVDLMICATASYHRLTVVHDDNDFATAAQHAVDL
ncbi:MAG: PIN domain-containing protein, partial [Nocardioides sp.]|uniref:PIN domain-containing protein n=1 Tax=Nocardioides sp. TaxID=35761 RepID=UPI003D6C31BE